MNLGTARILVVVALVAVGAVVLARGFEPQPATGAAPTVTPTPSDSVTPSQTPTGSETPTPTGGPTDGPEPNTTGVTFMSLNGTSVAGLAGAAQEMLEADGYVKAADADNSPTQGVSTTTVYYQTGDDEQQNKADAGYVAETYFDGAQTGRLSPVYDDFVPASASIVIVVGEDFADAQAA